MLRRRYEGHRPAKFHVRFLGVYSTYSMFESFEACKPDIDPRHKGLEPKGLLCNNFGIYAYIVKLHVAFEMVPLLRIRSV